jgi:hypothetical protein
MLSVVFVQLALADHWRGLNDSLPQVVVLPQDLLLTEGGRIVLKPAEGTIARPLKNLGVIGEDVLCVSGKGEFAVVVRFAGADAFEDVEVLEVAAVGAPLVLPLHFYYGMIRTNRFKV